MHDTKEGFFHAFDWCTLHPTIEGGDYLGEAGSVPGHPAGKRKEPLHFLLWRYGGEAGKRPGFRSETWGTRVARKNQLTWPAMQS